MRIHLSHAQASALHFPTSGKAIELYDVQLVASVTAIEEQQSANPEADELREKMKILQAAYTQSEEKLRAAREQLAQIPQQEEKPEQPERPESEPKKRGK
ncbi:MAG TPA: hypothetical protein PK472_17010 [Pseudomonadota bacterium]|nr:hypothetical protein [Pseudomonadota bacterium]